MGYELCVIFKTNRRLWKVILTYVVWCITLGVSWVPFLVAKMPLTGLAGLNTPFANTRVDSRVVVLC